MAEEVNNANESVRASSSRLPYIDVVRGFAILMVVVGHLIQYNYVSALRDPLFNIIYSFHMPLFFFISGVACATASRDRAWNCSCKDLLKKCLNKGVVLLIPPIIWTLLDFLLSDKTYLSIADFARYWFPYVLFSVYVFWFLLCYAKGRRGNIVVGVALAFLTVLFLVGCKRIPIMYLSFFLFGIYFQRAKWIEKSGWLYALSFLFFCFFASRFKYGDTPLGNGDRVWYESLSSIFASASMMWAAKKLCDVRPQLVRWLSYVGRYTFGIYLAQFYLVNIPTIGILQQELPSFVQFACLLMVAIVISFVCILLEKILSTWPLLAALMYGRIKNF